jgi:hypothetical protein
MSWLSIRPLREKMTVPFDERCILNIPFLTHRS